MRKTKRKELPPQKEPDPDADIDFWTPHVPIDHYCPRDGEVVGSDGYWVLEHPRDPFYIGYCSEICYRLHQDALFDDLHLNPPPLPL